jgi:hypothetical protein
MSAAAMIQKGVERDLYAVALKPVERDAILGMLEAPDGLAELRGCLLGISAIACSRESSGESTLAKATLVVPTANDERP